MASNFRNHPKLSLSLQNLQIEQLNEDLSPQPHKRHTYTEHQSGSGKEYKIGQARVSSGGAL